MRVNDIKRILILDQGDPVACQLLAKATGLFGTDGTEYLVLKARRTHGAALQRMEEAIREEKPELVLIGATALGEEIAPALGVRFETGVAAHCVDLKETEDERLAFIIPAFGGKFFGEIFIPGAEAGKPAIATVKPGIFREPEGWDYEAVIDTATWCRVIDADVMEQNRSQGTFRMTEIVPRERAAGNIAQADLIVCGGRGLGSVEAWRKLETLAGRLGGAAACTRAALDEGWGCTEDTMIGTSGRAVGPKVYVGLGISGAAHHTCGLTGAGTIININTDKDADAFAVSDYKGVFDAEQVIDALLVQIE